MPRIRHLDMKSAEQAAKAAFIEEYKKLEARAKRTRSHKASVMGVSLPQYELWLDYVDNKVDGYDNAAEVEVFGEERIALFQEFANWHWQYEAQWGVTALALREKYLGSPVPNVPRA